MISFINERGLELNVGPFLKLITFSAGILSVLGSTQKHILVGGFVVAMGAVVTGAGVVVVVLLPSSAGHKRHQRITMMACENYRKLLSLQFICKGKLHRIFVMPQYLLLTKMLIFHQRSAIFFYFPSLF